MSQMFIIMLFSVAFSNVALASNTSQESTLFLVGGGLKTCSSMSLQNCKTTSFLEKNHKVNTLYQVSDLNIERLFKAWPEQHLPKERESMRNLLQRMLGNTEILNKKKLRQLWKKYDLNQVINRLGDAEYYLFLDSLEVEQRGEDGKRLQEKVNISATSNPFSIEIFQTFVELAKQNSRTTRSDKKPSILVVTASARDTFEAVDFYTQVFAQLGANVEWLPIDAAVNAAWQSGDDLAAACNHLAKYRAEVLGAYFRETIYADLVKQQHKACEQPQAMIKKIIQADALFINGGDQSLTRKAFKNKDNTNNLILDTIIARFADNNLVVGGTSAGTALMSGSQSDQATTPMITNGRSEVALIRGAKKDKLPLVGCQKNNTCDDALLNDDLTYNSLGGIGLFDLGILDTHFSERGRQGRLMQLLHDTDTLYGFGVDETTAMLVKSGQHKTDISVVGKSGVFIAKKSAEKMGMQIRSFDTYYLTRDDSAILDLNSGELAISFANWKRDIKLPPQSMSTIKDVFYGETYKQTLDLLCLTHSPARELSASWGDNVSYLKITSDDNSKFRTGGIKVAKQIKTYCSYSDVAVTIH